MLMARNKNVHIMVDVIQLQKKIIIITPGKALTKISKPKKSRAKDGISWAE